MILHDRGRDPVFFHHGLRGKEQQHSLNPKNLPFLPLSLSLSLFLFTRKEGGEEAMIDCVRGCKGAKGDHLLL
jgi:hypothetical protein